MLFILYLISSSLIWNVDAQNPFVLEKFISNFDFSSILFGNPNGSFQDGLSGQSNALVGASASNTQQPSTNNGFFGNNRDSNNKQYVRASQQSINQDKPQQQNFQPSSQFQQNSYHLNQQSQGQSFQQNSQTQQQSYQQNGQQQQSYTQNVQSQQQLYNQNAPAQQQIHQQNYQGQQQTYQQNGQLHHQYQQNVKPQQQSYQQNQNFNNGLYSTNGISPNPSPNVLSTYTEDSTRTGKPNQNANYNNATFAITRFGLKMFKAMNRDQVVNENIVASPYSVATLLALVQQGANGDTQKEITNLLQLTPETSANLFKSLTTFMKKRNSRNIFKVGSNVVLANEFNISPKFKSDALNNFGSDVRRTDFKNPYNAAQQINQWVAEQTNQKIPNLLVPEAIQQDTLAMLVNAVYFKGVWNKKFDPKMTSKKEFTLSDGSKKSVPFMQTRQSFQIDTDPVLKSQILLMPFEGTQYTMMFLLPFEGVYVGDVLSSLTEPQLYTYQRISSKEVKVEIPKFNIKKDSDMSLTLNLLGLWKIFSPEVDLTGMGTYQGQSPKISSGLHSAVMSIDEQGSTAAAATVFSVVALSYDDPTTSFIADRPFLVVLWDKELSMPLFMAKIEDPQP